MKFEQNLYFRLRAGGEEAIEDEMVGWHQWTWG